MCYEDALVYRLVVPVEKEYIDAVYKAITGGIPAEYQHHDRFKALVSTLYQFTDRRMRGIDHLGFKMVNEQEPSWSALELCSIEIIFFDQGVGKDQVTQSKQFKELVKVACEPYPEFYACELITGKLLESIARCEQNGKLWFEDSQYMDAFNCECSITHDD